MIMIIPKRSTTSTSTNASSSSSVATFSTNASSSSSSISYASMTSTLSNTGSSDAKEDEKRPETHNAASSIVLKEHVCLLDVDETMIITLAGKRKAQLNVNILKALRDFYKQWNIFLFTNMDTKDAARYFAMKMAGEKMLTRESVRNCVVEIFGGAKPAVVTPADPGQEKGPGGAYTTYIEPCYKLADTVGDDREFTSSMKQYEDGFAECAKNVVIQSFNENCISTVDKILSSINDPGLRQEIKKLVRGFLDLIIAEYSIIAKEYNEYLKKNPQEKIKDAVKTEEDGKTKAIIQWKFKRLLEDRKITINDDDIITLSSIIWKFLSHREKYLNEKGFMGQYIITQIRATSLSIIFFDDKRRVRENVETANMGTITGLVSLSTVHVSPEDTIEHYKEQVIKHICLVCLKEYKGLCDVLSKNDRLNKKDSYKKDTSPYIKIFMILKDIFAKKDCVNDYAHFQEIVSDLKVGEEVHPLLSLFNKLLSDVGVRAQHLGTIAKLLSITTQLLKAPSLENQKKFSRLATNLAGDLAVQSFPNLTILSEVIDAAVKAFKDTMKLKSEETKPSSSSAQRNAFLPPPSSALQQEEADPNGIRISVQPSTGPQ